MWDAAMKLFSNPGVQHEDLRQLFLVFKAAEVELPRSGFVFPSSALLDRAREAWQSPMATEASSSNTERQVSACLHRLGVPHERSVLCPGIERTIDIVLEIDGQRLALEVDGPTHFLKEPQRTLNGSTLLRNRMLRAYGWTVLSVPFFDWNFPTDEPRQREAYLRKLLAPYLAL